MNSNKKVLIIIYFFPPEVGGSGVMRTVKFIKYLRGTKWEPVVLTVSRNEAPLPDMGLLEEILGVKVYRCKDWICQFNKKDQGDQSQFTDPFSVQPGKGFKVLLKLWAKEILIPDKRAGWILPAVLLGLKIIKKERIDLLYATTPPQTPLVVAYLLSLFSRKKLVLDYRDAWGGNQLFTSLKHWKNAFNTWLEKKILRRASYVVATTPAMQKTLEHQGAIAKTIYNGFDPEDFLDLPERSLSTGKVNFVYLGGFDGFRTGRYFAQALDRLEDADKNRMALYLVGLSGPEEKSRLLAIKGLEIDLCGFLPHRVALEYLQAADVLLIFIYPEEDSDRAIPSKIFEYIATGKPIIAFCEKESALGILLAEIGVGVIVPPKDVDAITDALSKAVRGNLEVTREDLPLEGHKFDRRSNARRLAELFEEVCSAP